jgi:hypothetical protein
MQAFWDHVPLYPYLASAPWPLVEVNGVIYWSSTVHVVEQWLETAVGPHYCEWSWQLSHSPNPYVCTVSFKSASASTLFLLKFHYPQS